MTKFSMMNIAHDLATVEFNERCTLLDSRLTEALQTALRGEKRLSKKGEMRVVTTFCNILENGGK